MRRLGVATPVVSARIAIGNVIGLGTWPRSDLQYFFSGSFRRSPAGGSGETSKGADSPTPLLRVTPAPKEAGPGGITILVGPGRKVNKCGS